MKLFATVNSILNGKFMKFVRLELAIKIYQDWLDSLNKSIKNTLIDLSPEQEELITKQKQISYKVLNILTTRDEVEAALKESPQVSVKNFTTIVKLDQQLKETLKKLIERDYQLSKKFKSANPPQEFTPAIQLLEWRASLNPNQEAWWWFWEKEVHQPNSDWVWRVISISCWTISLSLLGNIIPRFLVARPDLFSSFVVSVQSVFALLIGGSLLPQEGRKALTKVIHRRFPRRLWYKTGILSSFGLMLLLIGFRFSLPCFARLYNHWGWQHHGQYKLLHAESDYQRAIALNPEYIEAHFNLGLLYEDLQDFKQARKQYEIAFKQEYLPAWNNIVRLHILDDQYSEAEELLLQMQLRYLPTMDEQTKSAFWKNLGWVKWEQKNYQGAKDDLEQAIALKVDLEPWAAPHCLLAQVLEKLNEQPKALNQWEICLIEHSIYDSDELKWGAIAAERLEPQNSQP